MMVAATFISLTFKVDKLDLLCKLAICARKALQYCVMC